MFSAKKSVPVEAGTNTGTAPESNVPHVAPVNSDSQNAFSKLTTPLFGPYRALYKAEQERAVKTDQEPKSALNVTDQTAMRTTTLSKLGQMIWSNAKATAIIQGVASVVESAATLGSFYFGAKLFRSFETVYQGGVPGPELATNLTAVVGLGLVAAYGPVSRLVNVLFHSRMQVGFDKGIMQAIASRRQNELETESLRKEITTIRENQWRLPQLANGMLQSAGKVVELTFAGGLLSYVAYSNLGAGYAAAMGGLLLAATVPRIFSEYRHAKDTLSVEDRVANLRRKSWYLSYFATENNNVRELKNLGRVPEIQQRALSHIADTLNEQIGAEKRNAVQQLYAYAITRGTAFGCAAVFLAKAWTGELAPEILGLATGALYRFEGALSSISSILGEQLKHFQFAQRAVGLMLAGEEVAEAEKARRVVPLSRGTYPEPVILDSVSYTYHGKTKAAVSNINLTIAPGEFVAIVGPNGCGKTTLSKLIRGTYPPDSGTVSFGTVNLEKARQEDLNSYIANTGQDSLLFDSLTIEESIELGAPLDRPGIAHEEAVLLGLANDFIPELRNGAKTTIGSGFDGGQELSSGQKQMVFASRTFRREPKIMLLDEPGANLDPQHDAQLARNLDTFQAGECTRILITHNLRAAARRADRIIVMQDGVIAAEGSHAELMETNSWYRSSYEIQENGGDPAGHTKKPSSTVG